MSESASCARPREVPWPHMVPPDGANELWLTQQQIAALTGLAEHGELRVRQVALRVDGRFPLTAIEVEVWFEKGYRRYFLAPDGTRLGWEARAAALEARAEGEREDYEACAAPTKPSEGGPDPREG